MENSKIFFAYEPGNPGIIHVSFDFPLEFWFISYGGTYSKPRVAIPETYDPYEYDTSFLEDLVSPVVGALEAIVLAEEIDRKVQQVLKRIEHRRTKYAVVRPDDYRAICARYTNKVL